MSFTHARGKNGFGVVVDGEVVELGYANGIVGFIQIPYAEAEHLIADAVTRGGPRLSLGSLDLLPVIPRPGKTICIGLNYIEHAKEGGHTSLPDYPTLFMRGPTSLVGAGKPIIRPRCSVTLDYEAELAIIIGRNCRHVAEADALDYVAGYAAFNDASVREYQRRTSQWTPGKNFDATGGFGPELVTPDELPKGAAGLRIQSRLNGEVLQDANTNDMIFPVARTIAILSEFTTLEPGDVIATGTPAGVGHARKPPLWMKDGDICEIEIEGIGILRNPVRDEAMPAESGAVRDRSAAAAG